MEWQHLKLLVVVLFRLWFVVPSWVKYVLVFTPCFDFLMDGGSKACVFHHEEKHSSSNGSARNVRGGVGINLPPFCRIAQHIQSTSFHQQFEVQVCCLLFSS